jgi:hypothetical protein
VADAPRLAIIKKIESNLRWRKSDMARLIFTYDFFVGVWIVLKKRLCCPRVETAWRTSEPTAAKIMQWTSLQSLKALRSNGLNSRLKMLEVKYPDWHVSCGYLEEVNAQRTQIFILQILIL